MFSLRSFLTLPYGFYSYMWMDVLLIKETQKAILIEFDGKTAWLPKAWIAKIRQGKTNSAIKIKILLYHWSQKFD